MGRESLRGRAAIIAVGAAALGLLGAIWLPSASAIAVGLLAGGAAACSCLIRLRIPPLKRARTPLPSVWYALARVDLAIVGAEHYQEELREVLRAAGPSGLIATLVPQRIGMHDGVRVDLGGYTVGHLSVEAAARYRARIGSDVAAISVRLVGQDPVGIAIV
jgi:hypothetical protein